VESFPIIVCLIPAVLFLIIAGLYLLARYLRQAAESDLERLRGEWRAYDSARQQLEQSVQAYAGDQQEPFVSRLSGLQSTLQEINQQAVSLSRQRVELKQQANDLGANRWRAMLGAPYLWYFLRKNLAQLNQEIKSSWSALEDAGRQEAELQQVGWSVAQQARQVRQLQAQAHKILDQLRAQQFQGETFEAAVRQEGQAQATLAQLPAYFFEGEQEAVLSQAGWEEIGQAYQVLQTLQPELERLLAQAQGWEQGYTEAQDAVDVLRRVLADVGQTLNSLPPRIQTADYRQRLDQMNTIASSLHDTLTRLEVESLQPVTQEAARLTQLGQEMGHELRRARRELASLEVVQGELADGCKTLSLQLATLAAKATHPIAWGETMNQLADLNRQANGLASAQSTRPPGQIIQDMETAAGLRSRLKELERSCDSLTVAHTELLALLAAPELGQLETWLSEARGTGRQIQVYAAENWTRSDAIADLPQELNRLEAKAGELALSRPAEAIPEEQVFQRLQAARQLTDDSQRLRRRVGNLRRRLEDLQQSEKTAQVALESARSTLVQIGFVVRSNEFLSSTAAQEHERLSKELQNLLDELAQRQRGSVEKKARQTSSLVERLGQSASSWLERLDRDTHELTQELSATLKQLDEIATLDDKAVAEARRLLSSGPLVAPAGNLRRSLDELLPELKRHSDHWQACLAALHALGDFKPLIETYKEAGFQRDKTRQALGEAASAIRQKRPWPPASVTFEAEQQELDRLEEQWQALRQGQSRAIARVAQLSSLGARYQALGERVAQAGERLSREQAEAGEQETQINDALQQWQSLQYEYQANPQATQEIKELLQAVDRELAQIRRSYSQGGADYHQTLGALKSLLKRLRYYQVALDDESALDASGVVHRRRESQRGERF
jgi:DNA repair exonuclease SbcCD ATPase subunit